MKKLRLELEALDVVSFATDGEHELPRGTVHGRESMYPTSGYFTLDGNDSCYGMCRTVEYHTCWESQPSVGPSCDYLCTAPSVGCYPPAETEFCA